jgi:perosamine synthetase
MGTRSVGSGAGRCEKMRPSIAQTPVIEVMTEKFDIDVCRFRMSQLPHCIVRSVNPKGVVEHRGENFLAQHEALQGVVQSVFNNLPDGVCPLFYAIKVSDNGATMAALRARRIEAWAFW